MKVTINLWVLRNKNYDGVGFFSIHSIRELIAKSPEIEYTLLLPSNFNEDFFDFSNVKKKIFFPSLRHPLLYILYSEIILPIYFLFNKPHAFLSMDSIVTWTQKIKQYSVIYDINPYHFPEASDFKNRHYYNLFLPIYARRAHAILTISEYSKLDISTHYDISMEKIINVSCASNIGVQEIGEEQNTLVRNKYSEGKKYFFFIGSQMPRKNLSRLILAFDQFKKETASDYKLIISGRMSWDSVALKELLPKIKFKNEVIFSGRVSDEELTSLMSASYCLCFVSIYEGFGIPILEAMNCNVPVITSNVSSMPEIAQEAALYVNPHSIESISSAMKIMFENKDNLRNQLIEKGKLEREKFSWEKTGELIHRGILK